MPSQRPTESTAEQTFRSFTPIAASHYAQFRNDYHPTLYNTLLSRHTSTGGKLDTILDVGCGPGIAVRSLAPRFQHAIGLDPSGGMIAGATELGGVSASGGPIHFAVSSAEELSGIKDGSVDLLVAATAAHWFDLDRFWKRAAEVVEPGGSVGLWTHVGWRFGDETPNAEKIREEMERLRKEYGLERYDRPGTRVSSGLYVDLKMPWDGDSPVEGFDKEVFRVEWGTGSPGALPGDEFFAVGQPEVDLDTWEAMLGTTSSVARWREENAGEVGEEDVVRVQRRAVERLLWEAGVEKGKERVKGAERGVLLVLKRV
ncbi:hypothetical protein OQA88_5433 [Cercophora sp. LCS_1]